MLPEEAYRDLALYRLEKAARDLHDAKMNLSAGSCDVAANRAYFCIFHAMRAVLALDKKDYHKHSAVISFFSKDYIRTGHFERHFGTTIKMAGALRNSSDYDDYQDASVEEADEIVQKASEFFEAIKMYIDKHISKDC